MSNKADLRPFFRQIYAKSDKIVERLLVGYFFFGLLLSFFYDTYAVALTVGPLSLGLYFSAKKLFPERQTNQYAASLAAGLFMAQFIYQMHGLFEMHFTAFIAIIALITYQNKYAFIPQLLFVVIHHSSLAYLQYLGYQEGIGSYQEVYFTQFDYMDFQTFLFHAGLYAVGVALAALYAHNLEQSTKSSALNIIRLREGEALMKKNVTLAKRIAEGNFDVDNEVDNNDAMGAALVEMRNSLRESHEREREEKFTNVGLAEAGELFRNNKNLQQLAESLVPYLVKYMNYNQGALFILEGDEEDPKSQYLELKDAYAYERKKYVEKRVKLGEGLVGQCFLEKKPIYLKEIPSGYIHITSGLGEAPPSNVLLVPIMSEESVEGVIEFASFSEIKAYEIKFLEKLCETLAGVVSTTKINEHTNKLLEQSREQTEELQAQEEEMRLNMEELMTIQEDAQKKTREYELRVRAINNIGMGSIEFDLRGNIVNANEPFLQLMGYQLEEIVGRHHRIFVPEEDAQSAAYKQFWADLGDGNDKQGEFDRINRHGEPVFLKGAYTIIRDVEGQPTGVLKFVVDITPYKLGVQAPSGA